MRGFGLRLAGPKDTVSRPSCDRGGDLLIIPDSLHDTVGFFRFYFNLHGVPALQRDTRFSTWRSHHEAEASGNSLLDDISDPWLASLHCPWEAFHANTARRRRT
jgi:hypothetical protein